MNRPYILALFFSLSLACNNYCNGHGKCGSGDKCDCFIGWGGADCSLRSCPYDDAFVDVPLGDINHDGTISGDDATSEWRPNGGITEDLSGYVTKTRAHRYAECSNAGICNRESGECECFAGYEGSACQRRSCPTAVDDKVCSGHGSCLTSTTIIHDQNNNNANAYYGWESEKFMSCLCDKGWEGIDCNSKQCPKGQDPVTATKAEFSYTFSATQIYDANNAKYLKIAYDGIEYSTVSFTKIAMTNTCGGTNNVDYDGNIKDASTRSFYSEEIRRAVSTIPSFSKATVEFKCPGANTVADIKITLGNVDAKAFVASKVYACGATCTDLDTALTKDPSSDLSGDDQQFLCSRRGICNSDTGECECFTGYSGEACQSQRSIAL